MNETYSTERQMAVNALRDELVYMEQELAVIKEQGAYKDYTALMRTFLTTQKTYLQLVAEDENECTEKDALLEFTATL